MGSILRRDRYFGMLKYAVRGLRQNELIKLLKVYEKLQSVWGLFCSNEDWNRFEVWLEHRFDSVRVRKISYRDFRNELSSYIEKITKVELVDKLIILIRDSFNCKSVDELYSYALKIFDLKVI